MEKTLHNIIYYFIFGVWYVFSLLPFWFLYLLSDVLCFFVFFVFRYRRKVIHQNIQRCFPNMKPRQQRLTELRFCRHFCDIFFESFKFISMSQKELMKRMKMVSGIDRMNQSLEAGHSCAIYLGHYANWEWFSTLCFWSDKGAMMQLYHPLRNKLFDRLIGYTRNRFGNINVPMEQSLRYLVNEKKKGRPIVVGFIADQTPLYKNIHYWTRFFGHPTSYFTGSERLAQKFDMDVYYADIRCVKRGYYTVNMQLMTDQVKQLPECAITEMYNQRLEKTLSKNPAYWLWSHARWKRTYQQWPAEMEEIHQEERVTHLQEVRKKLREAGIIDDEAI